MNQTLGVWRAPRHSPYFLSMTVPGYVLGDWHWKDAKRPPSRYAGRRLASYPEAVR